MANTLFNFGREGFLNATISWSSATIKVIAITTSLYTFAATDQYKAAISGTAIIAGPVTLSSKTYTAGSADAADVTFSAVTGSAINALVIYEFVTGDSDSVLIAYIDTANGLPITPNGGDIIVTWDNGTNKIFRV